MDSDRGRLGLFNVCVSVYMHLTCELPSGQEMLIKKFYTGYLNDGPVYTHSLHTCLRHRYFSSCPLALSYLLEVSCHGVT